MTRTLVQRGSSGRSSGSSSSSGTEPQVSGNVQVPPPVTIDEESITDEKQDEVAVVEQAESSHVKDVSVCSDEPVDKEGDDALLVSENVVHDEGEGFVSDSPVSGGDDPDSPSVPVPPPRPLSTVNPGNKTSGLGSFGALQIGPTQRAAGTCSLVSNRRSPTGSHPSSPRSHGENEGYNSSDEHMPYFGPSRPSSGLVDSVEEILLNFLVVDAYASSVDNDNLLPEIVSQIKRSILTNQCLEIPPDLVEEILFNIPAENLVRFIPRYVDLGDSTSSSLCEISETLPIVPQMRVEPPLDSLEAILVNFSAVDDAYDSSDNLRHEIVSQIMRSMLTNQCPEIPQGLVEEILLNIPADSLVRFISSQVKTGHKIFLHTLAVDLGDSTSSSLCEISETPLIVPEMRVELPLDLMEQIYLRLPAKSLFRIMTASKTWVSRVRDKQFISKYFEAGDIIFLYRRHSQVWSVDPDATPMCKKVKDFNDEIFTMSQCDGLVLCGFGIDESMYPSPRKLLLWNPFMKLGRWIEKTPALLSSDSFCLGRDTKGQYKVLRFGVLKSDLSVEPGAQVCNLFEDSWREVKAPLFTQTDRFVAVNGNSYWLSKLKRKQTILSFDFSEEKFIRSKLPSEDFQGTLGLSPHGENSMSLIHQQDDNTQIWTKVAPNGDWEKLLEFTISGQPRVGGLSSFLVRNIKIIAFSKTDDNEAFIRLHQISENETSYMDSPVLPFRLECGVTNIVHTPSDKLKPYQKVKDSWSMGESVVHGRECGPVQDSWSMRLPRRRRLNIRHEGLDSLGNSIHGGCKIQSKNSASLLT